MKLDIGISVVHETIYRYIYINKKNGGRLYTYLRHKNKKYHHQFTLIKNVVSKYVKVVTKALIEIITPLKKISHTIRVYTS